MSAITLSKPLVTLFTFAIFASMSYAAGNGDLWTPVDESRLPARGQRTAAPEKFLTFKLDQNGLTKTIAKLSSKGGAAVVIKVPMPDGSIQRFQIADLAILAAHLAADFPTWRTVEGFGIDDPAATARFDWTSTGFHGYILTERGTVYIDPVQEYDRENYFVFYKHEYGTSNASKFSCSSDDLMSKLRLTDLNASPEAVNFSFGSAIRTYRLAIATTGEWARSTTSSTDAQSVRTAALAAMTTSVNRLDGIFRRELAATFQLVNPSITNETANIIFDNPDTDPYNNTDQEAQLTLNQTTVDGSVGLANYDIGHLYGTGGGGVASAPSICSAQKAEGYSARAGFLGDPFTVDYVAHEIGHQFGGSHTYNNMDNGGACTTRSTQNAFEVGSGSTIMSYVGICNLRNLQQYVDTGTPAFHIRSLTQAVTNMQDTTGGGACGAASGTNSIPTVNAGQNYTIPKLTPFTLTATGADADAADAGNLLYSWEEYDLAPSGTGQLGAPALGYDVDTDGVLRPLFRAYSPVASPSRTFPSLAFILNTATNTPAGSNVPTLSYTGAHPTGLPGASCQAGAECVIGESLPSVARTMNFRVAVRDGRGGIADAGMTITTVNTSGPFQVTSQNSAPAAWNVGSSQTVTWDVVGSNAAPINAANVNILLSTDGGLTFPVTLIANTPNDGSEAVTVPNNPTAQGRVKVEAAGNVFFDINNANFAVTGTAPGVSVGNATSTEMRQTVDPMAPEAEPVVFTISLSAPSSQPVTVRVSTNSITATEDGDFTAVDNLDVFFPANTVTQTVTVQTIEDPSDEPDETFSLDIVGITNAVITDGQGIGTIIDDDAPVVTVSGTVTIPGNRGVAGTIVVLVDSTGAFKTAPTNSFGIYSFPNVAAGGAYRIYVATRRYKFTPFQGTIGANSVVNLSGTE